METLTSARLGQELWGVPISVTMKDMDIKAMLSVAIASAAVTDVQIGHSN